MKTKKMRLVSLALASLMGLSLLSGCGQNQGSTSNTGSGSNTTQLSTEGRTDLVICMPEDLETFDPISTSAMATQAVHKMLYVRLYGEDVNSQPVDWLAKEFNVISDTEIDITIQEGALFSDGTEITAEDVVYCLDRALASPNFSTLMATVETLRSLTLIASRSSPPAPLPPSSRL